MATQADQVSAPSKAQLLREKHEAAEAHNPTVEDVTDDEDIKHPPPSAKSVQNDNQASTSSGSQQNQKENIPPGAPPALDTQSEESFPALGGGPKSRTAAVAPPAWAAKKTPSATSYPVNNGASKSAGQNLGQSDTPPNSSAPLHSPTSRSSSVRPANHAPLQMAMPGKYTDSITLVPGQMDRSKPVQGYLDRLNKKSRATVVRHTARDGSSIVFEGSGPKKDVNEALRTIARELCAKQKLRVPIPASCRAHIIGQGGSVIQDISARTGARIQVPKADLIIHGADDDDSAVIDVELEGDPYAVELARLEIDKIVSARTSNSNLRLKDIPPEFFPFLAGPHDCHLDAMRQDKNLQIDVPSFTNWQHRPPPKVERADERPAFGPHPGMHVRISGDRRAAQEAKAQIEQHVEQLRSQLALEDHAFQRGQHQFIIGDRGMSVHDFLAETGCIAVIPPPHDDTEDITIIGPPEQLQAGVDRAATLAAEMQMATVDPRRHFADAPFGPDAHSRALSRYLHARQLDQEINRLYGAQVAFPHQSGVPVNWEIYSRDMKNNIQARSDLTKIIQAHAYPRVALFAADPFFHPHLRDEYASALRTQHGVNMIMPQDGLSHHVVLVCEGECDDQLPFQIPRQRPSESEMRAFEEAVCVVKEKLEQIIGPQDKLQTRSLDAPSKFHDKLGRYIEKEQRQESQKFPVQFNLGLPNASSTGASSASPAGSGENVVLLRGIDDDVAELEAKIIVFLEDAERDESERGYTTTFDFPAKFNGYLIGREGGRIRELKDQFDVNIKTLDNGKIEVKGPKAKADACKDHINGLRKKFEDEATYVLKIDSRYHGQLVGKKGADVNRLQDKYNVKIQFPHFSSGQDDQSNADVASEAGGRRSGRQNQAHDEVIVRGPRTGADRARTEILDLYQYAKDNSHAVTISVARQHLGSLIGPKGSGIDRLRLDTNAQIDFPSRDEAGDPTSEVNIVIRGAKQAVDAARAEIQKRVKVLENTVVKSIEVDRKFHGSLIGPQGSTIRRIVFQAGGPEQSQQTVKFPERGSDSSIIRIEGTESVVQQIVTAIQRFVEEQANQVTKTVDVPPEKHGLLIGPGGEARRKLEQQFSVGLEVPKRGSERRDVRVYGAPEAVAAARQYLEGIAEQSKTGQTIQVPQHLHHRLSENGRIFSQLKKDRGVMVDHGGQRPPPRPKNNGSSSSAHPRFPGPMNSASTPLITDEDNAGAGSHSWMMIPAGDIVQPDTMLPSAVASSPLTAPTIPWNLTGPTATEVAAAAEQINRALRTASEPSATGFLTLSDPRSYRFVIGPSGRNINSIREQTGCAIRVPDARNGVNNGRSTETDEEEQAIRIVGSVKGCEEAKDMILGFIKTGNNGGGGGSGGRRD